MGKVGHPDVVIMTSGGNNAGFGHIVDCIYHSDPRHIYGKAYKDDHDGTGDCAKALNDASNYIKNVMQQDLNNTINDILDDPNVKNNPKFFSISLAMHNSSGQTTIRGATQSIGISLSPRFLKPLGLT